MNLDFSSCGHDTGNSVVCVLQKPNMFTLATTSYSFPAVFRETHKL